MNRYVVELFEPNDQKSYYIESRYASEQVIQMINEAIDNKEEYVTFDRWSISLSPNTRKMEDDFIVELKHMNVMTRDYVERQISASEHAGKEEVNLDFRDVLNLYGHR